MSDADEEKRRARSGGTAGAQEVHGTAARPRLAVFRSNRHISAAGDRRPTPGALWPRPSPSRPTCAPKAAAAPSTRPEGRRTGRRAGQGRRYRARSCSTVVGSSTTAESQRSPKPLAKLDWSSDG